MLRQYGPVRSDSTGKADNQLRVLLVQLYGALQPENAEPLSAASLAAYVSRRLPSAEVEILALDPMRPGERDRLLRAVRDRNYQVIGLSVPQGTLARSLAVMRDIRQTARGPEPLIVLGHALPTNLPGVFLEADPRSIVVRGWGEQALVDLLMWAWRGAPPLELEQIAGISFTRGQRRVSTPPRGYPPMDLDVLPVRAAGQYFRRVESSRGCHYGHCTFCTRPPGDPRYWSRLPLDRIANDISDLKAAGVSGFTFADEDFIGSDFGSALKVAAIVAEAGGMRYSASIRSDNIWPGDASDASGAGLARRRAQLAALRASGLLRVFVGVESFSDSQLRRYGKGVTAATSAAATRLLAEAGFEIELGFIPFDPLTTLAELRQNADALRRTGLWNAAGNIFSRLRVQAESPLIRSKRLEPLLTTFDEELMAWDWVHSDHQVAGIYQSCSSWWSNIEPAYAAVRNLERTTNSVAARAVARSIRKGSLDALDAALSLTWRGLNDDLRSALKAIDDRCRHTARRLVATLSRNPRDDVPEVLIAGLNTALDWRAGEPAEPTTISAA